MADQRNDLPPVSSPNFLEKVREAISTYLGNRGNKLDRGLTVRDLADAGIVSISDRYLAGGGRLNPIGGAGPVVIDAGYIVDLTPPPTPTGFVVSAAFENILITVDAQTYTQGHGHGRTKLYGSTIQGATFDAAELLMEFQGTVAAYPATMGTTYYLWVTNVSKDGVESVAPAPSNDVYGLSATTAQNIPALLEALTGEITASELHTSLGSRIDLIDGGVSTHPALPYSLAELAAMQDAQNQKVRLDLDAVGSNLLESLTTISSTTALVHDAGVYVDPSSGAVKIAGLEAANDHLNTVDVRLNAAEGDILLKATTVYVDNAIATAVLDPSQVPVFSALEARVSTAEVGINSLESSVTLKASNTDLSASNVRITTAENDINALEGQIALRVTTADFENVTGGLDTRVESAETTLSAFGGVSTVKSLVTQSAGKYRDDAQNAETLLRSILNGETTALKAQELAVASTELAAHVDAGMLAEAASRTVLEAVVNGNLAAIESESIARSTADSAEALAREVLSARLDSADSANAASIVSEATARSTETGALATRATNLEASVSSLNGEMATRATISYVDTAKADAISAAASATQTVQSQLNTGGATASAIAAAQSAANAAQVSANAAAAEAVAKASLAEVQAKAYADGIVTDEEARAIADASAKSEAARAAAVAAAAIDASAKAAVVAAAAATATANAATAQTTANTAVTASSANASAISNVQARLDTGDYAAVKVESAANASAVTGLYAQYTVKLDVNGKVSGYGLASTGPTGTGSTFEVRADKFVIAAPTGSAAGYVPFSVLAVPTVIGGITLPAGVYAQNAFIQDAQITNAKIGALAVDDAKIANLSAAKLTIGDGTVGGDLKSTTFSTSPGSEAGWKIQPNGTATFNNAIVRGTVYATNGQFYGTLLGGAASAYATGTGLYSGGADGPAYRWRVGSATGARIQWNGSAIEVYNGNNQLTLASGGIGWDTFLGGIGGNMIPNSDLTAGGAGWEVTWNPSGAGNYTGPVTDLAGVVYSPAGGKSIGIARSGTTGAASNWFDIGLKKRIPVLPNTRYELSCYLSSHRCVSYLEVVCLAADGATDVGQFSWVQATTTDNGGTNLANWDRPGGFFTTPANCVQVFLRVRSSATTSYEPYTWATRFFLAQAGAAQTELSPWSAGGSSGAFSELDWLTSGNVSTYIEDAAITSAKIGTLEVGKLTGAVNLITPINFVSGGNITTTSYTTVFSGSIPANTTHGHAPQVVLTTALGRAADGTFGATFRLTVGDAQVTQSAIIMAQGSITVSLGSAFSYGATTVTLEARIATGNVRSYEIGTVSGWIGGLR